MKKAASIHSSLGVFPARVPSKGFTYVDVFQPCSAHYHRHALASQ